jgi:hypothetical protein
MRTILCLSLLAIPALADSRAADAALYQAMRQYHGVLRSGGHAGIDGVRDLVVANLKEASPKYRKSILNQLDMGFKKSYGERDIHFYKCLAEGMAAGGKQGIAKVYRRYKSSLKKEAICIAIVEALGGCGDDEALSTLLKICFDKRPDVASVAVAMCAKYPKVKVKERKSTMRKLIDLYNKVSSDAAGKERDSKQMQMYLKMKPRLDETLSAFSGGEQLDSPQAWDAWLRENITKEWEE